VSDDRAPLASRVKRAGEAVKARAKEREDAWDFLVNGDSDGRHAIGCPHDEPCRREYDPMPYPEAAPTDPRMYDGSGIGALYGGPFETCSTHEDDDGEHELVRTFAGDLAGWNLNPRSTR
jgi:hypothetical protein